MNKKKKKVVTNFFKNSEIKFHPRYQNDQQVYITYLVCEQLTR